MSEDTILSKLSNLIEAKFQELQILQKPLLTVDELATYLGLTPAYIRKMTHNREIPYYKPGGKKIYFDREEVDDWIRSSRIASADEIRSDARQRLKRL